jgi:hypothetical protein
MLDRAGPRNVLPATPILDDPGEVIARIIVDLVGPTPMKPCAMPNGV